jgi:hypothetical protein
LAKVRSLLSNTKHKEPGADLKLRSGPLELERNTGFEPATFALARPSRGSAGRCKGRQPYDGFTAASDPTAFDFMGRFVYARLGHDF